MDRIGIRAHPCNPWLKRIEGFMSEDSLHEQPQDHHAAEEPVDVDVEPADVHRTGARDVHWAMIKSAMLSVADTVIFPVQDVLGLDGRARMNTPGVAENNWRWRMRDGALTPAIAARLKGLTELSDREG